MSEIIPPRFTALSRCLCLLLRELCTGQLSITSLDSLPIFLHSARWLRRLAYTKYVVGSLGSLASGWAQPMRTSRRAQREKASEARLPHCRVSGEFGISVSWVGPESLHYESQHKEQTRWLYELLEITNMRKSLTRDTNQPATFLI